MQSEEREQDREPQLPEATIEDLQRALEEERARAEEYLSSWKRAQADFVNYKRRTEQERGDLTASANAGLIMSILPVIDDLERAIEALPEGAGESAWAEGFRLIYRKLKGILESQGLKEVEAIGKAFDPRFHEAISYEEGGEEGTVIHETRKGYIMGDRILRPAQVVVGKGIRQPAQGQHSRKRDRGERP